MGIFGKDIRRDQNRAAYNNRGNDSTAGQDHPITPQLDTNLELVRSALGNSPDIVTRTVVNKRFSERPMGIIYIDGLVDMESIQWMMRESLLKTQGDTPVSAHPGDVYRFLLEETLAIGSVTELHSLEAIYSSLFEGNTVILLDGCEAAFSADTSGGSMRSVEEPSTQTVIRGPKEGFTENIRTNTSLLRRIIKSPALRIQTKKIGAQTQTNVAVVYLEGVANEKVVDEIHRRLGRIETDSILESGYIEEFIQDATFTPFPTMMNTERPDSAAAAILEGQVVIIVDGTPFVLMAPVTFFKFFQSSEDYYQRYDLSSFLRLIRFASFLLSMLLPSLYIAITTFHQEMLPTTLLISLAAQREGVPFPALLEAMLMEITFEVLREAGVRMPRVIGPAISIVGALVLGQAAVQAGLVSAAMVIVVSFTAIANFVIPAINMAIAARLIRFMLMLLAATLGLFGIMSGLMILLIHMAGLRSFGIPYLMPVAPLVYRNLKDVFIRVPMWAMRRRPGLISDNTIRQGTHQRPSPPNKDGEDPKDKGS